MLRRRRLDNTELVLIRPERPGDIEAVRAVVEAAFARSEVPALVPAEVGLLDQLRADPCWLPELALVAVEPGVGVAAGDLIVGHVVCSRGAVDGAPALGLGPLAVRPDRQGQGVGSALMHAVLGAADALGEPLVALLGEPAYYRRFGFRSSSRYGIEPPDSQWGEYFQVRPLAGYKKLHGIFTYAEPFGSTRREQTPPTPL